VKRIPAERPPETFPDFGPCWKPVQSHVGFPVPAAVKQQAVVPSKSGVSAESLVETSLLNKRSLHEDKTNAEQPSLSAKVAADLELTAESELKAEDVSQLFQKDSALLVNQGALMRIFNVLTSEPVIRTAVRELREQLRE
jgi:hypothetical protein